MSLLATGQVEFTEVLGPPTIDATHKGPNYTILYSTLLYYPVLYDAISYYTILYSTLLYYTLLYYTLLYYTILSCTVLYHAILYHTILYSTLLYSTILHYRGHCNQLKIFARMARYPRLLDQPETSGKNTPELPNQQWMLPRPPNVPLFRVLWPLLSSIWYVSKGSWWVLVYGYQKNALADEPPVLGRFQQPNMTEKWPSQPALPSLPEAAS